LPAAGVCIIGEQMPGYYVVTDVTLPLSYGYFGSYNIAYSPLIANVSGQTAMLQKYGIEYSYDGCPRGAPVFDGVCFC
jgi:hypothetical protein